MNSDMTLSDGIFPINIVAFLDKPILSHATGLVLGRLTILPRLKDVSFVRLSVFSAVGTG